MRAPVGIEEDSGDLAILVNDIRECACCTGNIE